MNVTALLASDLDGTLIPLEEDRASIQAIASLKRQLDVEQVHLTYVTGRHLSLAMSGARQHDLPLPQAVIADVGTSLWHISKDGQWIADDDYDAFLAKAWQGQDAYTLGKIIDNLPLLTLQPEERQAKYKRSYHIFSPTEGKDVVGTVQDRLKDVGVSANLIYSYDPLLECGLLDVLPPGASKRSALEALCKHYNVRYEDTVYAGDSGNDLEVFLSGCRSILVGNTPDEITEKVISNAEAGGFKDKVYKADARYTAGVLEGCKHFGLFKP